MSAKENGLKQVLDELGSREDPKSTPIPKDQILSWMGSSDLDVLGVLYAHIFGSPYRERITPPLQLDDYFEFLLTYFRRCFLENPESNWASTRYEASWDLVKWFNSFWEDQTVPRPRLKEIKLLLEDLYRSADEELRTCIVNATLEHLFENHDIADYFNDWQQDPLLKHAYGDALLWSEKGGTSPLRQ